MESNKELLQAFIKQEQEVTDLIGKATITLEGSKASLDRLRLLLTKVQKHKKRAIDLLGEEDS